MQVSITTREYLFAPLKGYELVHRPPTHWMHQSLIICKCAKTDFLGKHE